jgi:addiction module HigA family antidote
VKVIMPQGIYEPEPITPGDVLRDEILATPGVTQETLATAMRVSRFSINQIINDRRSVTADMALRLAKALTTTPEFWLNLQQAVDLHRAKMKIGKDVEKIDVVRTRPHEMEFADIDDLISASENSRSNR